MPEGIVMIDWDEFEGGIVSFKYPEIDIPINLVQTLQISHSFNPGLITIQEEGIHALSIGNEELQKVIVLILTPFEDASDFTEIMEAVNRMMSQYVDNEDMLNDEMKKIYALSQSVFKAREAVMNKLTTEVTFLKNRELDLRQSLRWIINQELDPELKILLFILNQKEATFNELQELTKIQNDDLQTLLNKMIEGRKLELRDDKFLSMIHYLI